MSKYSLILIILVLLAFLSVNHSLSANSQGTVNLGPIAYWSFNNIKNKTVIDDSGDNLTGILVNTNVVSGLNKQALYFNGKNSYMQVNDSNLLHFSKMSISIWIKPLNFDYMARIIGKGPNSTESFGLFLRHGSLGYGIYIGHNQSVSGGYPDFTQAGVWHNIVYVYDGTNNTIYLDGRESMFLVAPIMGNNTEPLLIGIEKNPTGFDYAFNGSIDEVRIYNRVISADEALALYMVDRPVTTISQVPNSLITIDPGSIPFLGTETTSSSTTIFTPYLLNQIITLSTFSLVSVLVVIVSFTTAYYIRERRNYKKAGKSLTINEFIKKTRKKPVKRKEINTLSDKTLKDLESIIEENK